MGVGVGGCPSISWNDVFTFLKFMYLAYRSKNGFLFMNSCPGLTRIFTFSITKFENNPTKTSQFRGIFLLFLPRTLLYSSICNDFYLYTYKRSALKPEELSSATEDLLSEPVRRICFSCRQFATRGRQSKPVKSVRTSGSRFLHRLHG